VILIASDFRRFSIVAQKARKEEEKLEMVFFQDEFKSDLVCLLFPFNTKVSSMSVPLLYEAMRFRTIFHNLVGSCRLEKTML
jgi:hypothetical protein